MFCDFVTRSSSDEHMLVVYLDPVDGNAAYPEAPNLEISWAGEEGGLYSKTELYHCVSGV